MEAAPQEQQAGIVEGKSFEDYCMARGINATILKQGRKSMKHLRYAIDHPDPDTDAMRFGRVCHAAVFEHSTFNERFAIWDGLRRAGKAWEAFKEANADKEIIKIEEAERAVEAGKAAISHPLVAELVGEGSPEVSLFWIDEGTGIECKARLDWMQRHQSVPVGIVDLKTASDIHHFAFGKQFEKLGYHLSLGWYRRGVRAITGMNLPVWVVAQENKPPYDTVRISVPEAVLDLGEQEAVAILQQVKHCKKTGRWPGRCEDEDYPLNFPEYAMPEDEVSFDG